MKIIKSKKYKVGICGIRAILNDKERSVEFELGNEIEVNEQEFQKIDALKWGVEVKGNGSDTKNINKEPKDRVTTTK